MSTSLGSLVAGRYRIIRLIKQGGYGAVYLAEDVRLGHRIVAIKESFDNSEEAQEQFRLEAHLLASLEHLALPRVMDTFVEIDGRPFLVMDFIEGDDLETRFVQPQKPMSDDQAARMILQITEAVAYLHNMRPQPIIHRDIKPANIKITPNGLAVLVDFGIAKIYHPTKGTAAVAKAVSPPYSPPEQYGGRTDTRSDVYALGVTLYALVCCTERIPDALERLANGTPVVRPTGLNPQFSAALEEIIMHAVDLDPNQRFADAREMAEALRQCLKFPLSGAVIRPGAGTVCPVCGFMNRSTARFCAQDGSPLTAKPAAVAVPAPAVEDLVNKMPAELRFEMANNFARSGDHQRAIVEFQACLQAGLEDQAVYHNLGLCYILADLPRQAVPVLTTGVSKFPADADLEYQLARAYWRSDDDANAAIHAEKACLLQPNDPIIRFLYADILREAQRLPEAIEQYQLAIDLDPASDLGYYNLGRAYVLTSQYEQAVAPLMKAIELNPDRADSHFILGMAYHGKKQYNDSVACFREAVRLEPSHYLATYFLGEDLIRLNQLEEAAAVLTQAVGLDASDPDGFIALANCYRKMNRLAEAQAAVQRALAVDPQNPKARDLAARLR